MEQIPLFDELDMSDDDKQDDTTTEGSTAEASSPDASDAASAVESAPAPTQSQLYDDLRRIGQLEDEKLTIQKEIDERTERLRNAIPTLDKDSLLYQMLTSCLTAPVASAAKKKTTKKKSRRSEPRNAANIP